MFALLSSFVFSQPAGKWSTGGNAIVAGDFIGTTNNFPFDFRVNNVQQMSLSVNGVLTLNALSGTSNRILFTDTNGNITALAAGTTGQFLKSNGTWGNLPLSATSWGVLGNDIFNTNTGNTGIGTNTPSFKLDVNGSVRIKNDLLVEGQILISEKVQSGVVSTDTIRMAPGAGGQIIGDIRAMNKFSVDGNSLFSGKLTATQGVMFDNAGTKGISLIPGVGANPDVWSFGRGPGAGALFLNNPCFSPVAPTALTSWQFPGILQIYSADPSGNYIPTTSVLTLGSWGTGSSIDVAGGGVGSSLLMNYFCGKDIGLCTGGGGKVAVGNNLEVGFANTDLNITANINAVGGTKVAIGAFSNHISGGGYYTKIVVNRDDTKAIGIINGATGVEGFKVMGDGKTIIGKPLLNTSIHFSDALLTVNGKVVGKSLYVTLQSWADYVFKKDYKLSAWEETENYFIKNEHLKGVPTTKEVMANGVNVGETQVIFLTKLEEAYLYLGEAKKEIKELRDEIKELKREKEGFESRLLKLENK